MEFTDEFNDNLGVSVMELGEENFSEEVQPEMVEENTQNESEADVLFDEMPEEENAEDFEKSANIDIEMPKTAQNPFENVKLNEKAGVYVKVNSEGYTTEINSDIFIDDFSGWIKIDEGEGEKYTHAQTCYFDEPIVDEFGRFKFKR